MSPIVGAERVDQMNKNRLETIDAARGLAVAIMALDHVREYFGSGDPLDLGVASPALFATRWITHLCAPMFFLLTGVSAYLRCKEKGARDTSAYLLKRGLLLILIEITWMRCLAYQFNFDYQVTGLLVLWALGCAMLVLSVAVRFDGRVCLALGLGLAIGSHPLASASPAWLSWLFSPAASTLGKYQLFMAYPPVPWAGIALIGLAMGRIYDVPRERRLPLLGMIALLSMAAFVLARLGNLSDPNPWSPLDQRYILAFINTSKYPPSLEFIAMTLGMCTAAMFVFALFERRTFLNLFGKSALWFYAIHFTLIHGLAAGLSMAKYGTARGFFMSPTLQDYPFTRPPDWGLPLHGVYLVWILVLLLMVPACCLYRRWKSGGARILKYV